MREFPCYGSGQDCPRRAVGCRTDCQDWKDAQESHQAQKAAKQPTVAELYRAQKAHTDILQREHRKGGGV
jgi:predicted ATP-dependent serine protease